MGRHASAHVAVHPTIAWLPCRQSIDTWQPRDEALYLQRGKKTAREGYVEMSKEYLQLR